VIPSRSIAAVRARTVSRAAVLLGILVTSLSAQQLAFPITDKITGLAGTWTRDPSRGTGGICGVSEAATLRFELQPDAISVMGRSHWQIPLTGAATSGDGLAVASTDAGWLKVTTTIPRNGGFANIMQEVYILNRDRSELTLWRTLNVRRPDGAPDKIDCGNRAAVVYRRQAKP
jgi:hypothetical protein